MESMSIVSDLSRLSLSTNNNNFSSSDPIYRIQRVDNFSNVSGAVLTAKNSSSLHKSATTQPAGMSSSSSSYNMVDDNQSGNAWGFFVDT